MQNKGAIRLLAIVFAIICVYQISFTFFTIKTQRDAVKYSGGDPVKERKYLDSMANEVVYNFFWLRKYTYMECKEREINLGLDLKGGMNVILEVSVEDILKALSNYSTDKTFNSALARAKELQKESQSDYLTLFGRAFQEIDPNAKMASVFNTVDLRDQINFNSSNEDVLEVTRKPSTLARALRISSVMPSLKYSFSASLLILTNGRTAILFDASALSEYSSPCVGTTMPSTETAKISIGFLTFLRANLPRDFDRSSGWLLSSS